MPKMAGATKENMKASKLGQTSHNSTASGIPPRELLIDILVILKIKPQTVDRYGLVVRDRGLYA